jgi:hypothetical protein
MRGDAHWAFGCSGGIHAAQQHVRSHYQHIGPHWEWHGGPHWEQHGTVS